MTNSSDSSFSFHKHQKFELPFKKPKPKTIKQSILHLKFFNLPLISTSTGQFTDSISIKPYKPITVGRKPKLCDFVFTDKKVSKKHFQLLFDSSCNKIYLSDGLFTNCTDDSVSNFFSVRVSLNGVYVNGVRINGVVELRVGDSVRLNCLNCGNGFSVEKIVISEEVYNCNSGLEKLSRGLDNTSVLLSRCRDILCSDDPVNYIQRRVVIDNNNDKKIESCSRFDRTDGLYPSKRSKDCVNDSLRIGNNDKKIESCSRFNSTDGLSPSKRSKDCVNYSLRIGCHKRKRVYSQEVEDCDEELLKNILVVAEEKTDIECCNVVNDCNDKTGKEKDGEGVCTENGVNTSVPFVEQDNGIHTNIMEDEDCGSSVVPPGKRFYLNRLRFGGQDLQEMSDVVSLPQLFHPIESLERVFIATFTSDISWFVSYCKIPDHLSVTIACHNTERCWNSDPDKRTSVPLSDFPNLTMVYPLFPEAIAFNKDRNNSGIGCHHPKLIVLQREENLRVIITSANLVARQWLDITNTVWWQDFPRLSTPDCSALFTRLSIEETSAENSDFAAQLAGFMASLVADVASQAHWMLELVKYDFKGAVGYLVSSVPGIHSHRSLCVPKSKNHLVGNRDELRSCGLKPLASVEASVVGLSHIYRSTSDSNGTQIKKLAWFLGKCQENMDGMSEIVLRRNTNIHADKNAISVLVPNPQELSVEDSVQLGFLPRDVAKWVAPLSDRGLFAFSAYIYPKESLAAASEGSSNKVKLILYVYEGPSFSDIYEVTNLECVAALCSLVSSCQRHAGLWRLKEVLARYKWPEHLESEFFFGSSSVGAVTAQFLAAFSAAAGKRSVPFTDSDESDPEWGCWSASHELKNPSLSIIFPSIETVKSNKNGIMASRCLLCFSQKTWHRLKNIGILHDAIPSPSDRVGFPMHVKVGRRRFRSKKGGSSFGWVYNGSHNFSAAAWGLPISDRQSNRSASHDSVLGSRLRILNYELGIIFVVPPKNRRNCVLTNAGNLDDIVLPFAMPPPKYETGSRPATALAMREALAELSRKEMVSVDLGSGSELLVEEVPEEEEEEVLDNNQFVAPEMEDEKAYADQLWSQVDSSERH